MNANRVGISELELPCVPGPTLSGLQRAFTARDRRDARIDPIAEPGRTPLSFTGAWRWENATLLVLWVSATAGIALAFWE
jgi:hypothetical protein